MNDVLYLCKTALKNLFSTVLAVLCIPLLPLIWFGLWACETLQKRDRKSK
jgi:hypothetical protein